MKAYMGLTCEVGAYNRVLKKLLDLKIPRSDIFLLFGSFDILIQFSGLKNLEEFITRWFNSVRVIAEDGSITKTMTFIAVSEGPSSFAQEPYAFIFMNTVPRESENIKMALLTLPDVLSADRVFGPYDIICPVKAKDRADLERIMSKIHDISGIEEIVTAIVAETGIFFF